MGLIYVGEGEGDKSLDLLKCLFLFRVLSDAEYMPRFSIVALCYTHTVFRSPSGQPKLSAKFHDNSGCPRFVLTAR
jgi:hypothetical protein